MALCSRYTRVHLLAPLLIAHCKERDGSLTSLPSESTAARMARLALAVLAASAMALRPATTRVARAPTQRNLFGGAPPEEDTPASPPPGQGGQTMSVPGLGDITEEEMKLAMEFRQKMAQKMQETRVEGSALGGKVKVVYGERSANTPNEDNGPLAESAQRVISLQVVLSDGRLLDIFFYDELAAMVNNVRPNGSLIGILLQVRVDPARVVPAEPHPRMVQDTLLHRRRAGRGVVRPARAPDRPGDRKPPRQGDRRRAPPQRRRDRRGRRIRSVAVSPRRSGPGERPHGVGVRHGVTSDPVRKRDRGAP